MGVLSFRRGGLPAILILVTCLVLASPGLAAPTPQTRPDTIEGFWVQQRLGTPDMLLTFVDADHGWGTSSALRNGVYRTSDGGATWNVTVLGDDYDTFSIQDIFFINAQEGWATGERDYFDLVQYGFFLAHTTDGGATWRNELLPADSDGGGKVWFVSQQQGWVMSGNALWRTTDGKNWTRLEPSNMPSQLIRFINATTGFGIAEAWDGSSKSLRRTTDGGASWSDAGSVPTWANRVWVASNGKTAWAVGKNGKIARTLDTGATWTQISSPTTKELWSLAFTSVSTGWAAGMSGTVLRTTDGGLNWFSISAGTGNNVSSLAAAENVNAWVFAGEMRRTRDGGEHWSALRTVRSDSLFDLAMPSSTVGWAGGAYPFLLGTADGGSRWVDQPAAGPAVRLDAVDPSRVWTLFEDNVRRTLNGGDSWETYPAPQGAFDIDFVNPKEGWLITQQAIYHTADGGQTWKQQYAPVNNMVLQALSFADAQTGWVKGKAYSYPVSDHLLLRTIDGGKTWREGTGPGYGSYYGGSVALDFVSPTTGWAIDAYSIEQGPGMVARTTDGGASWKGVTPEEGLYTAVNFLDAQEGWVAGTYGRIYRTTNGGDTWTSYQLPSRITVRAIDATAPGLALFVGDGGLILQYSATEPAGCWATPTPAPQYTGVPPAEGTIQRRIAHCMDDTYVRMDTEEQLYDRDYMRMGARDGGSVTYSDGLLFRNVRIPQGAHITSARLRLEAEGHQSGAPIVVSISGEAKGQSADFSPPNWWGHLWPRTSGRVPWTINTTAGGVVESPDISSIVQEVVGLSDWRAGNNLSILIDAVAGGQQYVNWWAYDGKPSAAAELVVSYRAQNTPMPTPTATPTQAGPLGPDVYLPLTLSK